MTREAVCKLLRIATETKTNNLLLNELQNIGAVSDNAVTIDDVADSDLMRALNKLNK